MAEALDCREDVVGGLDPSKGLGIGVAGVDVGGDVRFQLSDGAVRAAPDLIVREQTEEALDLIGWDRLATITRRREP